MLSVVATAPTEVARRELEVTDALRALNANGRSLLRTLVDGTPDVFDGDLDEAVAWFLLRNRWAECGHPVFWDPPGSHGCPCRELAW